MSFRLLLLCLVLLCGVGRADEPALWPGELPMELGRELVGTQRLPRLAEIEAAVKAPEVRTLAVFRMHGDAQNHYAPCWSADGRSFALLRAHIEDKTCKVLLFPNLHDPAPKTLYEDSLSYEHMLAWASSGHERLAFSSNRGRDRTENIHLWDRGLEQPRALTEGPGIKVFPQLESSGPKGRVLFRRIDQFELLTVVWRGREPPEKADLGPADEMRLAPGGGAVAIVRPGAQGQELVVRDLLTRNETRVLVDSTLQIRNPAWSPDGELLAFWAKPRDARGWELWTGGRAGTPPAGRRAAGVRVQEDFRHVGPAWSSDGQRIWFTSTQGEQSHYPLQWISPDGTKQGHVDYDRSLTTAIDVAACPSPDHAVLAFSAIARRPRDVYVVLLNHP